MGITVIPTGAALGAEVRGLDLASPLDDADHRAIERAWHEHLVLLFRNQSLSPPALAAFSRRFGILDMVPAWRAFHAEGVEEVLVISNVKKDGKPIGVLGSGESEWHTDMSYQAAPPRASILHALEVPPEGGETSFINMYRALEALPGELRAALEGRALNHDSSYDSSGSLRPGAPAVTDVRSAPGARHPAIRLHPETQRRALFLGRRLNAYIVGCSIEESEQLLDRIWLHVRRPEFAWTHHWRKGDVLLWDNRCTMHRREPFDSATRRVMHRTQIKGEAPLAG
ncbi:MAG: TauD/TfdA family dioxygenase [Alphaproteobacteria bacterium]